MKKIIALFVVMLGFGFTASAQQKKATKPVAAAASTQTSFAESAKKDVVGLDKVVALTEQQKQSFQGLFEYKYRELELVANSAERKAIVSQTIDAKVRATLTPEQMAKLDAKPEVLKKITH